MKECIRHSAQSGLHLIDALGVGSPGFCLFAVVTFLVRFFAAVRRKMTNDSPRLSCAVVQYPLQDA
jgi:hypothetical protein